MTLAVVPGGFWYPRLPLGYPGAESSTTTSIISTNASAKIAMMGRVAAKQYFSGTKNLQSVEFMPGSITAGSGSPVVRLSAQGVSTSTGAPARPDGTIRGATNSCSVTFATSAPTSSTWYAPGNFGEVTAVSWGDPIAIVWDWSAAGTGATFPVSIWNQSVNAGSMPAIVSTTDGTTWTALNSTPNVVLKFDDATLGMLDGGNIFATLGAGSAFTTSTNPNEFALVFQVPFSCKMDAAWAHVQIGNTTTGTYTVALKDGSANVINSCTVSPDPHFAVSTSGGRVMVLPLPETTLSINTDYYLSVLATGAGAITPQTLAVNNVAHLDLHDGGQNFRYASRNGGAWSVTTTLRPRIGIRISQLDDGAGASGMLYSPGLSGGMDS